MTKPRVDSITEDMIGKQTMVDQEELDWMEHLSKCAFVVETSSSKQKKCGLVHSKRIYTTNCQVTVCESLGRYVSMTKQIENKSW